MASAASTSGQSALGSGSGSSSPFSPGVPQQAATTPTTTAANPVIAPTTTATSSGGGGLSGTGIIIIVVVAVALLCGAAAYIYRDSRRHAPIRARTPGPDGDRVKPGSKRPQKARKLSPQERKRRKRGQAPRRRG